jgi:uncharacterized membrane protein
VIIVILAIMGVSQSKKDAEADIVTGRHDAGTAWQMDGGEAKHGVTVPAAKRVPVRVTAARTYIVTSVVVLAISGLLGYLFYSDFTKYFTIFHKIFFDNDLWLLDPAKDDLINLLPEGFFSDTALAILIVFLVCMVISFIIAIVIARSWKKKRAA